MTQDPKALGDLTGIGCGVLNYCNWQDPTGLPEAECTHFLNWFVAGSALVILDFANGAFHHSLLGAGAIYWTGYRRVMRQVWQVWDHTGASQHNHHCQFIVRFGG